jgi:hypothetical protein
MSRIDMNMPNTMIRNANRRFGAILSEGAALAAIAPGVAVVMDIARARFSAPARHPAWY